MNRNDKKAISLALIPVFFWSTVATVFKLGLQFYSPAQLLFIASLVSFLLFTAYLAYQKKLKLVFTISVKSYVLLAVIGFITPFLYYLILFRAYSLLPAQLAQPLNMIWPIVLTFMSVPLLKQKIGFRSYIALFVSFIGIVFLTAKGNFTTFENVNREGVFLAIGSSFLWATYWVLNQKIKIDSLIILMVSFGFATIYLLLYLAWKNELAIPIGPACWTAIYIGLFEVGISFIVWSKAMAITSNNAKIANLIYIAPFISLIFVYYILGEKIFYTTFIGLIFIVLGIFIQQSDRKNA